MRKVETGTMSMKSVLNYYLLYLSLVMHTSYLSQYFFFFCLYPIPSFSVSLLGSKSVKRAVGSGVPSSQTKKSTFSCVIKLLTIRALIIRLTIETFNFVCLFLKVCTFCWLMFVLFNYHFSISITVFQFEPFLCFGTS